MLFYRGIYLNIIYNIVKRLQFLFATSCCIVDVCTMVSSLILTRGIPVYRCPPRNPTLNLIVISSIIIPSARQLVHNFATAVTFSTRNCTVGL